jgi:hypothetical protein
MNSLQQLRKVARRRLRPVAQLAQAGFALLLQRFQPPE